MSGDIAARLDLAKTVARDAGDLAVRMRMEGLEIETKNALDFVTQADRAVEALIVDRLRQSYPSDGFVCEETGITPGHDGSWVIDPIDGTTNYMMGLDHWSVSIAYMRQGRIELGCVYAPDREELFEASLGGGSRLNGRRLRRRDATPGRILFGLGISNRVPFERYVAVLEHLAARGIEHRRFGSAALSISDVAAGRLDGYFEPHINLWDAAAALIVAREADADAIGFDADEHLVDGDRVYAAAHGLRDHFENML